MQHKKTRHVARNFAERLSMLHEGKLICSSIAHFNWPVRPSDVDSIQYLLRTPFH